jgi:secreted trypsin-like serine protease
MRRTATLAAALAAALAVAGIALAQTNDAQPDGNGHPNVGALLMPRADGSLRIICTGTLVSPRVFLTAAHCTSFMEANGFPRAYVTFDPEFGLNADHSIMTTPYVGKIVTNPGYKAPYGNDTAIVLLDKAVKGIAPAKIAPVGFLDDLKASRAIYDTRFTNVGYGTAEQVVVPGTGPTFPFDGIRKWTTSGFYALDPSILHLNQNIHQGESGTGYGDSGGPSFVGTAGGDVQVSVVSSGDVPCWATSTNTRIDTAEAHAFLAPYLALR